MCIFSNQDSEQWIWAFSTWCHVFQIILKPKTSYWAQSDEDCIVLKKESQYGLKVRLKITTKQNKGRLAFWEMSLFVLFMRNINLLFFYLCTEPRKQSSPPCWALPPPTRPMLTVMLGLLSALTHCCDWKHSFLTPLSLLWFVIWTPALPFRPLIITTPCPRHSV